MFLIGSNYTNASSVVLFLVFWDLKSSVFDVATTGARVGKCHLDDDDGGGGGDDSAVLNP